MTHDAPLPAVALRPSRRLWWHALAALALVCLTVGVVFLVTRRDRAANAASSSCIEVRSS